MPNYLPKWLYYFAFSPAMQWELLLLHILASFLDLSHSSRCMVVSRFNLQLRDGKWCQASFYMLICHLNIFGEVSVQIFYPFFNWVVCFVEFEWVHCIFWKPVHYRMYILSDVYFANVFSRSDLSFHSLTRLSQSWSF